MRILLFLLTNAAVLLLISVIFHFLGLGNVLRQNGVNLDLNSLLLYSAVIGMSGSFISLVMSKWMAKHSMGVFVIEQPSNATEQWLLETVRRLAQNAGIGMPEVGIFDSPDPNAFATGMSKNSALVAVSTGLLHHMDADAVEAVLGHEISHVANGDMVTLGLLQGVVNTFVIFFAKIIGFFVDRVLLRSADDERGGYGPGYFIAEMVAQILLSILATMIVMWFSRYREFRADAGGAKLAGRDKMINALRALQRAHDPQPLPGEMAAFGINAGGVSKLFMSHPPLEERIEALRNAR
ncbi:protease HtpX [Methylococcus sp. EFPC2]|uniref:protease HtpX n=1 Tax=Methylococcus sp. EFPC2 TaxID=2812648 RepID=UPI001967E8D3|nr:protease HtpX [Methylococcus sp. EFPC2]QSA98550.1 protease HtpX [Methylococcus sp. EFPC2]